MFSDRKAALTRSWSVWVARVVAVNLMVSKKVDWEEVMALRSLRVLACWVGIASMNVLVGVRSGRMSERRGVSLVAMASEMIEALVSRTFSSMRNAATWMAWQASVGTLGSAAVMRRMRTILERS